MGSGTRPEPPSALQRVKDDGKSGGQAKSSRNVWIAPDTGGTSPAAGSHDFEDGRAEGVRSPGSDLGCAAGAAGLVRPARYRRPSVRGTVAGSGPALPGPDWRAHRIRRRAGSSYRRRSGYLPHAVTVRTVRAESDVQPSIRDSAGGARDGRTV